MKLLVLDNYDSFTYNLVHLVRALGVQEIDVFRNDKIDLDAVDRYDSILLSPGPGIPLEAGIMPQLVKRYAQTKKILGVCLGHQCIGEVFGGTLLNLKQPIHGKALDATIIDPAEKMFSALPKTIDVGRYHSWAVERSTLPSSLIITAEDSTGTIMALRHRELNVRGVQFHPESILTSYGREMIKNWIEL